MNVDKELTICATELVQPDVSQDKSTYPHCHQKKPATLGPDVDKLTSQGNLPHFRLYRRRYAGMLGIIVLNIVTGMNGTWFGPVAKKTSETFGISLDEVNWLGNIIYCISILVSPLVPILCSCFGLRISYAFSSGFLVLSAWVRYAGTAHSLDEQGAYALLIVGQLISAVPQAVFQILVPKFSEKWFDLKSRTTATMLMSVSNPVGAALGQLISPMFDDIRKSILALGIISTVGAPFTFLIGDSPPTPPSFSGSHSSYHLLTTLRAIFGLLQAPFPHSSNKSKATHEQGMVPASDAADTEIDLEKSISRTPKTGSEAEDQVIESHASTHRGINEREHNAISTVDEDAYMTIRERADFLILTLVFSVIAAGTNTFSLLSNEILEPYGYSDGTAGLMGAALLLSGLVAAFVTSPLFDRVLAHHLGLSARIAVPIIAAAWLSLIWAVRPNNTGALFAIFVVIGVCSVSMLPVALELGCELTRNSDGSSAILWWSANLATIVFILAMSDLRAPQNASPPLNMHRALIYCGASICAGAVFIFMFRGQQRRREKDELVAAAAASVQAEVGSDRIRQDSGS